GSHAAERFLEDILKAAKAAAAAAPCGPRKALRPEIEVLEMRVGTKAATRARSCAGAAKAFKAAEARLALGVDLAAIARLALVLIAAQFMRGIQLGKACRRFRIIFVGIGMQFFREPPIGALDV